MTVIAILSWVFGLVAFLQGMNVNIGDKRIVIYYSFTVVFTLLGCVIYNLGGF